MKHAYLILAHGDYQILELLISQLDDARNDIFVHIDKKSEVPELKTEHAGLQIIRDRVDVRWGDVSVLKAEFALMRAAQTMGYYAYYHLLSGVDLVLKSQDYIHRFFAEHQGTEFVGFYSGADLGQDLLRKVGRYHLFADSFRGKGLVWQAKRAVRALWIRAQERLGRELRRNTRFAKGTQWFSITQHLVQNLLVNEMSIVSLYEGTFCCDEIAVQTFVYNSPFMARVYDQSNEGRSCLRHIGWQDGTLHDFSREDLEELRSSDAIFARKFNSRDMDFLREVVALSQENR